MTRELTPWAIDEIDALRAMMAEGALSIPKMAARLGRSRPSVQAKMAWLRGSKWARRSQRPGYVPGRKFVAEWSCPAHRENDHYKHLGLILGAHRAGFPVCGGGR